MVSLHGQHAFIHLDRANVSWGRIGLTLVFALIGLLARAQVNLRLTVDADGQTYKVYMQSAVSYSGRSALLSTSQVTLVVPHGLATDRFEITNLVSPISGMIWRQTDRVDAPVENPDRDYLFFSFINNNSPLALFDIKAGQDILLFQFKRKGPCLGQAQLINNKLDEFKTPNSKGINTGNSVSILGAGGNIYSGNLDEWPTVQIRTSSDSICSKQAFELQAELSRSMPNVAYRYQWFVDDQPVSPVSETPKFVYSFPDKSKNYSARIRIKVTTAGADSCEGLLITATKRVFVKVLPTAQISYVGETCTPLPVTLSAVSMPKASYQWIVNNQPVMTGHQQSFTATEGGYYSVAVTANGCSAVSHEVRLINVSKAERTEVRIGNVGPVVAGQPVKLQPQIINATSFIWSPADQLSSATVADPVATLQTTTSYRLTVQSDQGCVASDTVTIKVVPALFIPTAFTPNSDGVNDTWVIQNISHHQPCRLQVVNRWGNVVYDQTPYQSPWDAIVNGEAVESGMYHYVLTTPYVYYSGSIQVLR